MASEILREAAEVVGKECTNWNRNAGKSCILSDVLRGGWCYNCKGAFDKVRNRVRNQSRRDSARAMDPYHRYRKDYDVACSHVDENGQTCGAHRRDHSGFADKASRVLDHAYEAPPISPDA